MSLNQYTRLPSRSGLEARLQAMTEDIRKCHILPSSTIQVEERTNGTMLSVRRKRGSGDSEPVNINRFVIVSVSTDTMVCSYIEDDTQTETIYKSDALTGASPRDVEIDGQTFSESVYPAFEAGDEILAGQFENESGDLEWVDITPGRSWRLDMREVVVCINNDSNWRMLIPASAPYRPT